MARSIPNSFDRVFGGHREAEVNSEDSPPSVHDLFIANMRNDLSLGDFVEALASLHGMQITSTALKLLRSTDASSGRLSYQAWLRAMKDGDPLFDVGAGRPMEIKDQAAAIIHDNLGSCVPGKPPSQCSVGRPSTDINNDPFIKQQIRLERAAAKGPFPGNPVVQTNHVSAGNPLCGPPAAFREEQRDGATDAREMANTATRMFVANEISCQDYEAFLKRSGVQLDGCADLRRLIINHDKVGDGSFAQLMRLINRQIATGDA